MRAVGLQFFCQKSASFFGSKSSLTLKFRDFNLFSNCGESDAYFPGHAASWAGKAVSAGIRFLFLEEA